MQYLVHITFILNSCRPTLCNLYIECGVYLNYVQEWEDSGRIISLCAAVVCCCVQMCWYETSLV